eukprot:1186803-Rhodomonas_salina.2
MPSLAGQPYHAPAPQAKSIAARELGNRLHKERVIIMVRCSVKTGCNHRSCQDGCAIKRRRAGCKRASLL